MTAPSPASIGRTGKVLWRIETAGQGRVLAGRRRRHRLLRLDRRAPVRASTSPTGPSAGPTTRAAESTRARRSGETASASRPTPGSIFCLRRDGRRRSSGTRTSSATAFRYESFYASASTDGRRLYTASPAGQGRRAERAQRRDRLDGAHGQHWPTRRRPSPTAASSSAGSTAPCTRTTLTPAPLWARNVGGRSSGPRSSSATSSSSRTLNQDLRGYGSPTGRSSGGSHARQVRARDRNRPTATTSRSTGS